MEKTPGKRRKDLVFMQNGMLGPFLEKYGLEDNTQCLVYFAVAKKVRDCLCKGTAACFMGMVNDSAMYVRMLI